MGYNKSLSAVYSDIWERYKHHCEHEGIIALNRFCEGEGIKAQRLYEWLRRRKISISDYQESLSGMPAGAGHHEEALFREVRLPRPSHARGDAEAGTADVVRDIRIEVTPEVIERHIGISREFNTFELVDAVAARDGKRVFRILAYFRSNPKAVPLVLATASVFNFFADLLQAYYSPDRSDTGIMNELKLRNQFALRRIKTGMSRYTAVQVVEILSAIRQFDVRSKGVGSRQNEHQLFFDLMYHILSAPGRL